MNEEYWVLFKKNIHCFQIFLCVCVGDFYLDKIIPPFSLKLCNEKYFYDFNINNLRSNFFISLNLEFLTQAENIHVVLLSFPIKIWGKSHKRRMSNDLKYKQRNKQYHDAHCWSCHPSDPDCSSALLIKTMCYLFRILEQTLENLD